jgi:hypothetical protein
MPQVLSSPQQSEMQRHTDNCQCETLVDGSRQPSWIHIKWQHLRWHLENEGLVKTCQRASRKVLRSLEHIRCGVEQFPAAPSRVRMSVPPLGLQPGEMVDVKSEKEIQATLDADSRTGGLAFLPEMLPYCGKRFRVFRRVNQIMTENGGGFRKLKNTVLLEGVICNGKRITCDRSCFLFWREAWLRRVPVENMSSPPAETDAAGSLTP